MSESTMYRTRDGRRYNYCKGCKNKDFTCGKYCPKCGRPQSWQRNKQNRKVEFKRN